MNEFSPYESPLAETSLPISEAETGQIETPSRVWCVLIAYAVGGAVGGLLWGFSLAIFGHKEPWDGDLLLYNSLLLFTGFTTALLYPRVAWAGVLGVYVGQTGYLTMCEGVNIVVATLAIAAFGLWPAAVGAILGALAAWKAPWNRR